MTFVIAETPTSTWNYHIRRVGPEGIKLGGGDLVALCGAKLGWDTQIPFSAWGKKGHVPSTWCAECNRLHKALDK